MLPTRAGTKPEYLGFWSGDYPTRPNKCPERLKKWKGGRLFGMGKFNIDSALFFLKYGDDGFNVRSSAKYALGQKDKCLVSGNVPICFRVSS